MLDAPRRPQIRGAVESWAVFLLIGLLLSSCTPTTGTGISLTQEHLTTIKRIGVLVKKEETFSVRLSREKATAVGAALFGLIGAAIEAGARASADAESEGKFIPMVVDYDPQKLMDERLQHYLRLTNVFSKVVSIEDEDRIPPERKALDGLLELTLKEWGLRLCLGVGSGERVQVGLNVHGSMFLVEDGSTVWTHDELYLDQECHSLEAFLSREGLLKDALSRTIDNFSGKIVNEIIFPQ